MEQQTISDAQNGSNDSYPIRQYFCSWCPNKTHDTTIPVKWYVIRHRPTTDLKLTTFSIYCSLACILFDLVRRITQGR